MSIRRTATRLAAAFLLAGTALPSPALAQAAAPAEGPVTLIHAGTVLAQPGERPLSQQTIVVRDGKVVELRAGFAAPADVGAPDAKVVDLKDGFVLPGLIDAHVHLTGELGPGWLMEEVQNDPEEEALVGAMYAVRTLQAGFTTIRELGAPGNTGVALRDAIESRKIAGPTIVAAGQMISISAGHGDVNGFNEKVTGALRGVNTCDGADDCRRAVREQIRRGADAIKLATTGGVLSNIAAGTGQQMFDDEIRAIVETAHLMGKKVAAHAHAGAGVNAALRAGVDSIEHGSYLDDESIKLFRQTGAYLVPTLTAGRTATGMAKSGNGLTPAQARKALTVEAAMKGSFAKAVRGGVKIAFGTDAGVSPHGRNAEELSMMVEAGMPPAEAIKAATLNAADLLGIADRVGSISAGKDADIIAVTGNPLDDIKAMEGVSFVMRRGEVHRQDGKPVAFTPGR